MSMIGVDLDFSKIPVRLATDDERKRMRGSIAAIYELKVPVLHIECSEKFFVLMDYGNLNFKVEECDKLVVLQTEKILPSIFLKKKGRKKDGKSKT